MNTTYIPTDYINGPNRLLRPFLKKHRLIFEQVDHCYYTAFRRPPFFKTILRHNIRDSEKYGFQKFLFGIPANIRDHHRRLYRFLAGQM